MNPPSTPPTNPYKQSVEDLHKLTFRIGHRDWTRFRHVALEYGQQDILLSRLFARFIELTLHRWPDGTSPEAFEIANELIDKLELHPQ